MVSNSVDGGLPITTTEDTPLIGGDDGYDGVARENRLDSTRSNVSIEATITHHKKKTSLSNRLLKSFSSAQREKALKEMGVGPAVFLIREAVRGEKSSPYEAWYDPYAHPERPFRNLVALICGRLVASIWLTRTFFAANLILVLLTFIEPPHWCRDFSTSDIIQDNENDDRTDDSQYGSCWTILQATGTSVDGEPDVEYYPNYSTMILTVNQSMILELICLCIIVAFTIIQFGQHGLSIKRFFFEGYNRRMHTFRIVLILCEFATVLTKKTLFNPFLRLLLLGSYLKRFQRELRSLIKMLPQLLFILVLLGIMILFYGWFGVVMFIETPQGKRDFQNLIEGCWTMYQCVTTVNYPDVMMPSYNENRLAGVFWVSFMVFSFFFLMNLILASAVNAYEEMIDERKKNRTAIAKQNLSKAFDVLDPNKTGLISRDTIMALFHILSEDFPNLRTLNADEAKMMFGFLDRDGSSTINREEFQDFAAVFLLEFTRQSDYATFVEIHFPKVFASRRYQSFCTVVRSAGFEYAVDFILLLNAVVIFLQSYPELSGQDVTLDPYFNDGYIDTVWELMETIFTGLYVLEACSKIMVDGWKKYTESMRNVFDFIITFTALFATAYVYYPNEFSDSRLIRFVVMARVMRLGRILLSIPQFQVIGTISAEILPAAIHVITVLLFLMYWFAALGLILYGGLITRDPANPLSTAILNNDFSDNDYWANNFNDMMSGMNVLFNLLVINNWTNCEIGFEAVTGGKWVRFYFLAFYIFGVILINNLVIAFIINAFFQQLATLESRHITNEIEGEAVIQGELARFDSSEITGTSTGTTGKYIARIRTRHHDVEIDEREGLKRLFTQQSSDVSHSGTSKPDGKATPPP